MKKIIFLLVILLTSSCNKNNQISPNSVGQNIAVLVQPNQTDQIMLPPTKVIM